jgi:hypothetical protein
MKKIYLSFIAVLSVCNFTYAQWTISPTNPNNTYYNLTGNVGIGTSGPTSNLHLFEMSDSKPGGNVAPTKSIFKLSRAGTPNYSYNESAEFRIGHGGPYVWGSQLDLFINGGQNSSNIPDQQVMTWLYNGNVGIGTTNPLNNLQIGTQTSVTTSTPLTMSFGGTYSNTAGANPKLKLYDDGISLFGFGISNSQLDGIIPTGGSFAWYEGGIQKMILNGAGNLGVGTTSPQTSLHIVGPGTSIDASQQYTGGGLIVQGNTGGRSTTTGSQLEFVIPGNNDGSNLWGQGRIITVAGNTNNGDATGKMILGTRRLMNKVGAGVSWYYGNDLTINGNGNVIIGQSPQINPAYILDVFGTERANQIVVNATGADFVFDPKYKLSPLSILKIYIDRNHHLPEIPSAKLMQADGLNLGDNQMKLLQKVEELTLYTIAADKKIEDEAAIVTQQQSILLELQRQLKAQQQEIDQLKSKK